MSLGDPIPLVIVDESDDCVTRCWLVRSLLSCSRPGGRRPCGLLSGDGNFMSEFREIVLSRKSWMSEEEVGSRNGSQDITELAQMDGHLLLSLAQELGGRDIGIANQASRSLG